MYEGESVPQTGAEFEARVSALIDQWCERRALDLLRLILRSWPMSAGLTDAKGEIYEQLHLIAGLGTQLPDKELDEVADLATFAWRAAHVR